jgi:ribosome-binding ATPase YchF (GTP1/OBG family)
VYNCTILSITYRLYYTQHDIIIGGPPNPGKSTFVSSMKRALWEIGVKVSPAELDLWAPTLEFLEGKISKQERDSRKQKEVTKEEAEEASIIVSALQHFNHMLAHSPVKVKPFTSERRKEETNNV